MKKSVSLLIIASLSLSACSLSSLNPFSGKAKARGKYPENAVEYRCDENKRFAVQVFNQGQNAWLIYPDHQVNLDLQSTDTPQDTTETTAPTKQVYASGLITLTIADGVATLVNGEKEIFTSCKPEIVTEK